jgi:glutamate-5-semialdehyde dehydrogenase
MRVPLGVIAIIYEARPNVTCDAAGLHQVRQRRHPARRFGGLPLGSAGASRRPSLEEAGLPAAAVTMLPTADRKAVAQLLKLDTLIDLVIPRGKELIRAVVEVRRSGDLHTRVCHT